MDTTASLLEEYLSGLPTQTRERVIEILAEHAREENEREELLHALADLYARGLELQDSEVSVPANLGNLQHSAAQLRSTLSKTGVFAIAQEIVTNLIDSEAVGLFELAGSELILRSQLGIDPERARAIHPGDDLVGQVLRSGRSFFCGDGEPGTPELFGLTACVPLQAGDRPVGLIVVFELQRPEPQLTGSDRELLERLGTVAGFALYCARLHENVRHELQRLRDSVRRCTRDPREGQQDLRRGANG